jgi:hypothetical protein
VVAAQLAQPDQQVVAHSGLSVLGRFHGCVCVSLRG